MKRIDQYLIGCGLLGGSFFGLLFLALAFEPFFNIWKLITAVVLFAWAGTALVAGNLQMALDREEKRFIAHLEKCEGRQLAAALTLYEQRTGRPAQTMAELQAWARENLPDPVTPYDGLTATEIERLLQRRDHD
jgi:hypothetical protein